MGPTKLFIFLTLVIGFFSCNKPADLTEDEVYSIMNEVMTDDSIQTAQTICDKFVRLAWNKDFENHFSKDDIGFFQKQDLKFFQTKIQPDKLKRTGWRILVKKNISPYLKVDSLCSDTVYHSYFSFPIISIDRKKVLFHTGSSGLFLGGGSGTYLYEKINNRWTLTKTWDLTVS